jgi:hypothetical protein
MRHLTAEQLVDAIDGAHAPAWDAHLQSCEACRGKVTELEALRVMAADADNVPEPSPLFWDHLSARVHDAVAADGEVRIAWWRPSAWPWLAMPVAGALVLAFALGGVLTSRLTPAPPPPAASADASPIISAAPTADDASLNLVADLASQMDWDDASEIGVPLHAGAADEAIDNLSPGERQELQRLLQELARPGA